jgi:Holliday junction DNA helicase RuvA
MITYVEGIIAERHPTRVVIDVAGIGYELLIPLSSYDGVPAVGQTCRLLTVDHVREDQHVLFGFVSAAERQMFVLLRGISGIGPKLALSALSGMRVDELRSAVAAGDTGRVGSISGIGKKTAERIIVELRDKIGTDELDGGQAPVGDVLARDSILALVALGHRSADAERMVRGVLAAADGDADVEDVIRRALAK